MSRKGIETDLGILGRDGANLQHAEPYLHDCISPAQKTGRVGTGAKARWEVRPQVGAVRINLVHNPGWCKVALLCGGTLESRGVSRTGLLHVRIS